MNRRTTGLPLRRCASILAVVALGLAGCGRVSIEAGPQPPSPELQALLDRAAIENLYADYYTNFGGDDHDFAKFYTADGVLDVNGMVAKGADAITRMYVQSSGGEDTPKPSKDPKAPPVGKFHMMITNMKVDVHGDAATIDLFWDSLAAKSVVGDPRVTEFGREHTELVRQDGKWLMQHRQVTSYGGMPGTLLKSYVVR
jgi:ketosteroid isomerase-like protein